MIVSDWPESAVIYQIYPRSFRDSNGDGVGDLRGCIDGLDYIASLSVDAIWLSPFFASPMRDFGYDVSNYLEVDPLFGTLDDFDEFLKQAHDRDLKVIIDQVYSHTSDMHTWFEESRLDRSNAKADWYVWADAKPDGSPPNNWQSVFGGIAWQWDSRRRQYYLHNFLKEQPDLNLHNPEVQGAILDVTRFWLDRGVDGFRLDAINFAMHDPQLRDNPPAALGLPPARPYDCQEHRFDRSHLDIVKFLERIRAVIDEHGGAFTVAEVVGDEPLAEMKAFTKDDVRLTSAYSFHYLYARKLTPELVINTSSEWSESDSLPSWAFSNHDAPRAVSRWSDNRDPVAFARLALMLLVSLRGNVFVYQGEELGLPQADVPFGRLKDPEAIENWPATLGRDGARTPIPWSAIAPFAGFSTVEPWLPIDARHVEGAIDLQNSSPNSTLNFTRALLALRRNSPALKIGDMTFLKTPDGVLAFTRRAADEQYLCAFNLGHTPITWAPPHEQDWQAAMTTNVKGWENADLAVSGPSASPVSLGLCGAYLARRRKCD